MVEARDIVDEESLKAWLQARPEETRQADAVTIANRAALRVMPNYVWRLGGDWARGLNLTAIPILDSILISSVGRLYPTNEVKSSSAYAYTSALKCAEKAIAYNAFGAAGIPAAAADVAMSAAFLAKAESDQDHFSSVMTSIFHGMAGSTLSGEKIIGLLWDLIRKDAVSIEEKSDPLQNQLWLGVESKWAEAQWGAPRAWLTKNPGHEFWIRWYEASLEGRPLTGDWDSHWKMLHDIALIPDVDWKQGAEYVAGLIAEIENRYNYRVSESTRQDAEVLLKSALGRFGFNDLRNLMELLPFAEDLKSIQDAETVAAFIADMDQERREIETFLRAIEREGRALQGAGAILTYFEEILEEASKARQLSELNIAWIIDCGEILQGYSTSQEVLTELGPLSIPFKRTLSKLLDLIHRHFSATILRLAALRDIRSADETNLHALMEDLRRGFELIKDETSGDRIPMAPEALAVFEKLLGETNRLIQREFMATDPQVKSGLRRDIDYRMAQVSVSLRLYLEQAKAPGKTVVEITKGVVKKRVTKSVEGLVQWFLDFFSSSPT